MYIKHFAKFVWEEEVQALGMPHFYLGKHSFSKFLLYFYILFPAFIFLGIGSVLSFIMFFCELVFSNHSFFLKCVNLQNNSIVNKEDQLNK